MAGLTEVIKVRVDEETLAALAAEAAETMSSVGRIIRLAIHAHLAAQRKTERSTR